MSIDLPRRFATARWQRNGWDEPCKSRGLRTVLWAAGGEIPPADPATLRLKGVGIHVMYGLERRAQANHRCSTETPFDDVETGGSKGFRDKRGGNLLIGHAASGVQVA